MQPRRQIVYFTPRERQVALLKAEGLTTTRIAEAMDLSVLTVRSYMKTVYLKLDVHSDLQLVKRLTQVEIVIARSPQPDVKQAARLMVRHAIRKGEMSRRPCERCGTTRQVQAHHVDYSKPLDVAWLCIQHHKEVHHPPKQLVA